MRRLPGVPFEKKSTRESSGGGWNSQYNEGNNCKIDPDKTKMLQALKSFKKMVYVKTLNKNLQLKDDREKTVCTEIFVLPHLLSKRPAPNIAFISFPATQLILFQ